VGGAIGWGEGSGVRALGLKSSLRRDEGLQFEAACRAKMAVARRRHRAPTPLSPLSTHPSHKPPPSIPPPPNPPFPIQTIPPPVHPQLTVSTSTSSALALQLRMQLRQKVWSHAMSPKRRCESSGFSRTLVGGWVRVWWMGEVEWVWWMGELNG